ncbi:phage major capsid protein [Sphingopyxis sp. PET50]|uniref:phage major capsid protein n=1 Tax=Sphingopyxis sp. PET50 TaxID=2976533 RepID=UPI0021AEC9A1|nr:phage major capsid protein [Sphingopyxis sp. PET50]
MNIAEQIRAFEEKRAALIAANTTIMEKAAEEGSTLDAEQKESFDGNEADIAEIDDHLKRLRAMEKANKSAAVPAEGQSAEDAATSRADHRIEVKAQPKLEKGIAFARLVKSFGIAKGSLGGAVSFAAARYGDQSETVAVLKGMETRGFDKIEKAEVPAGANISGNWAEALVGTESSAFADFVEFLRPMTIIGRFGSGGIPSLRRVPFRVPLITQTLPGEGHWVGEGKPKPLTSFGFSRTTLDPLKVANIAVLTMEMVRDSSPSAEAIVRDQLAEALAQRLDIDFINPAKDVAPGVSPASITFGADSIAAEGSGDADDIRVDVRSLMQKFVDANNPLSAGVWIMPAGLALSLSMMVNPLGQPEFPGLTANGGTFFGLPVITSEYAGANYLSGSIVVLVNASDIYFADEGGVSVDMSREASLEMLDSSLLQNAVADVNATSLVSLWQTNSVGFLAERTVNWARRRATGVTYLTGAAWGGPTNT